MYHSYASLNWPSGIVGSPAPISLSMGIQNFFQDFFLFHFLRFIQKHLSQQQSRSRTNNQDTSALDIFLKSPGSTLLSILRNSNHHSNHGWNYSSPRANIPLQHQLYLALHFPNSTVSPHAPRQLYHHSLPTRQSNTRSLHRSPSQQHDHISRKPTPMFNKQDLLPFRGFSQ